MESRLMKMIESKFAEEEVSYAEEEAKSIAEKVKHAEAKAQTETQFAKLENQMYGIIKNMSSIEEVHSHNMCVVNDAVRVSSLDRFLAITHVS